MRNVSLILTLVVMSSTARVASSMDPPSRVLAFDSPVEAKGTFEGCRIDAAALVLAGDATSTRGTYTSDPLPGPSPFARAVPFWRAHTAPGQTLEVWARAWRDGEPVGDWIQVTTWQRSGGETVPPGPTDWLPPAPEPEEPPSPVASPGPSPSPAAGATPDTTVPPAPEAPASAPAPRPPIRLNQDTLQLTEPADALQLRLVLQRTAGAESPRVRALGAAIFPADRTSDETAPDRTPREARILDVPYRSQGWVDKTISRRVCGPTSLSMIMEFHGIPRETHRVAQAAYDVTHDIFGNWAFLAAVGSEMGLDGEVVFGKWGSAADSLRLLYDEIDAGRPFIMSIAYKEGALDNAPVKKTGGHLIVIRGYDGEGNFVVNDPGGSDAAEGQVTYDRDQLLAAWRSGVIIRYRPRS